VGLGKVVGKKGVGREVVLGRQEWDSVLWGCWWWGEKGGGKNRGVGGNGGGGETRNKSETQSCGRGGWWWVVVEGCVWGEKGVRLSLVVVMMENEKEME